MSYVTSRVHYIDSSSDNDDVMIITEPEPNSAQNSSPEKIIAKSYQKPKTQEYQFYNFNDIKPILPQPPEIDDEITRNVVLERNTKLVMKRLEKLNHLRTQSPLLLENYTPQELYIAFELSNFDIDTLTHRLTVQDSHHLSKNYLSAVVNSRKMANSENTPFINGASISVKDNPATVGWTKQEIGSFIHIMTHSKKDKISLSDISKHFPTHGEAKCLALYNYLTEHGYLNVPLLVKKRVSHAKFNPHYITSLTFIKGRSEYHVGQQQSIFDRYKLLNPLPDYIDQVTCQKMEIPALSQDGYVLDYYTWLKIIKDEKCNPFTRNPIISKRSLTILTIDNINAYRGKIINLDLCKPDN